MESTRREANDEVFIILLGIEAYLTVTHQWMRVSQILLPSLSNDYSAGSKDNLTPILI